MRKQLAFTVIPTYLWVTILLGSILFETPTLYPNIFHDATRSLEAAMDFLAVRDPSDYFPPLRFLSWVTGVGSLILAWRVRPARPWILGSLIMIVCEGLVSIAFSWPRNTIMFVEGPAAHSAAYLRQTAQEFLAIHWSRLAFNAMASALLFTGFLRFYRHRITSRNGHPEAGAAVGA